MLHDDPLTKPEWGGRLRERLKDIGIAQLRQSRVRFEPYDCAMRSPGWIGLEDCAVEELKEPG